MTVHRRPLMLGIETSCDETAAAVVTDELSVVSSVVASQIPQHSMYGGVVPEVAARAHLSEIMPVVERTLVEAGIRGDDLTAISVTYGPGLVGSLIVGASAAKGLALAWDKPIVAVNHLEGHLASAWLGDIRPSLPCLVLLVSGGHTLLALVRELGSYELLGSTRDDSVGEAYDKVARLLGLGYPGGPVIDRLAKDVPDELAFPRPMLRQGLNFSFSGLKTAVANYVRRNPDYDDKAVAASFAAACMDVLLGKLESALDTVEVASVCVVGGVAASPILRARASELGERLGVQIVLPPQVYATDNAAMIAAAGWFAYQRLGPTRLDFGVRPGLKLDA